MSDKIVQKLTSLLDDNLIPYMEILKSNDKIRNYFLDKGFGDIQNKKIYFEITHSFERINLSKGN